MAPTMMLELWPSTPGRRKKAVKANAALGELADVRRLDEFFAIATEPAADVLQINPKNVGGLFGVRCLGVYAEQANHQGQNAFHGAGKLATLRGVSKRWVKKIAPPIKCSLNLLTFICNIAAVSELGPRQGAECAGDHG